MRARPGRHLAGPTALGGRRRLRDVEFAVLDTETSGWEPDHAHVLQVAVVACRGDGTVVERWSSFVRPPDGHVGPTDVHRITFDHVVDAPVFEQVLPALADVLRGRVRVAHNLPFDDRMLGRAMARAGYVPGPTADLDTLALSAGADGSRRGHGLGELCRRHGVPLVGWHDARADAEATAGLLPHLLRERGLRRVRDLLRDVPTTRARADWPTPRYDLGVLARVAAEQAVPASVLRARGRAAARGAADREQARRVDRAERVRFRRFDDRLWRVVGPPDAVRPGLVVVGTRRGSTVVDVLDVVPAPDDAGVPQVAAVVRPVPLLRAVDGGWEVHGPAADIRPGRLCAVREDASRVEVEVADPRPTRDRDGLAMVRAVVTAGAPVAAPAHERVQP